MVQAERVQEFVGKRQMAKQTGGDFYPVPMVDQGTRPGAVARLIAFMVVLAGAAIVFAIFRERFGDPFLLGLLGVLLSLIFRLIERRLLFWYHGQRQSQRGGN